MIHILFGEMGSGKNYHGERLAKRLGVPFVDGDSFLPPDLVECLERGGVFTTADVERFFNGYLLPGLMDRNIKHPDGFVVAQALYNDVHRQELYQIFHESRLYWVKPSFARHIGNLCKRRDPFTWIGRMLVSKLWFQTPYVPHEVIYN
jgi:gluconate kinase